MIIAKGPGNRKSSDLLKQPPRHVTNDKKQGDSYHWRYIEHPNPGDYSPQWHQNGLGDSIEDDDKRVTWIYGKPGDNGSENDDDGQHPTKNVYEIAPVESHPLAPGAKAFAFS